MSTGPAGSAMTWCRLCDKDYPGHAFCPKHSDEELGRRPAAPTGRRRTECWSCGTTPPNITSPSCANCHESLVPPALVVEFPHGRVVVAERGGSAQLGRAGEHGDIFTRYPNVSRQHAVLSVDAEGDAWLAPMHSAPNGTFVNGEEIQDRTRLRPGDRIRFATDQGPSPGPTSEPVRQPNREPELDQEPP